MHGTTFCSRACRNVLLRQLSQHSTCRYFGYKPLIPRASDKKDDLRPQSPSSLKNQTRKISLSHRDEDSTIYALSTAPGRAAIAIIRISGPASLSIYRALCPAKPDPRPRHATVRTLYSPRKPSTPAHILDAQALVLYFPAPRTVTGEDLLELHIHGGPAIVRAVLAAISQCTTTSSTTPRLHQRIRPAEPGEFTRRAFANNRLSLPQIEALASSLSASTEQQRRLAVRGTSSDNLNLRYESWRLALLAARGELEALIDFAEDHDLDDAERLYGNVATQVEGLIRVLQAHCMNAVRGELLRGGIQVALLGAPNAGKSSLLNIVVGRDAAIVSETAGTTRDVVEVGVDLGGYLCRFGDTAGLRRILGGDGRADDDGGGTLVEREGMKRARARALDSDVVIVVLSWEVVGGKVVVQLDPEVVETAAELVRTKDNVTVVINKFDLVPADERAPALDGTLRLIQQKIPSLDQRRIHTASCKSAATTGPQGGRAGQLSGGTGIQAFLAGLVAQFDDLTTAITAPETPDTQAESPVDQSIWQESLGATERQRVLLEQCIIHLEDFLGEVRLHGDSADAALRGGRDLEGSTGGEGGAAAASAAAAAPVEPDAVLAAEHLRAAAACLARVTGKGEAGDVEEVLGVVFEKFCVGK